jgi:MoaA/NifB/PqqE/SkfB family radical SAM enzyme
MDKQIIFGQNKLLNHPEKVTEWLQGGDRTIVTVELDLTNRCNNRCPKCVGWAGGKTKDELTIDEVKNYLQNIMSLEAKGVIFTGGGEPLLHPNFTEALKYAKELNLHVGLITNGLALAEHNTTSILENCDWVRISIDAGNVEMYKKTHGMDEVSWWVVINNIKRLIFNKKELNSKCIIGLGYLTGKDTAEEKEMEDFAKLALELEVDYAQFRPFHNDFTDIKDKINILQKKYGNIITASWQKYNRFNDKNKRPYKKCYGSNFAATIGANGDMFVCCHMRGIDKYKLGSLRESTMKEIWKKRQEIFDKIDFKDCPFFCRCDEFNRLLDEIKKLKQHVEFL